MTPKRLYKAATLGIEEYFNTKYVVVLGIEKVPSITGGTSSFVRVLKDSGEITRLSEGTFYLFFLPVKE